MWHIIVYVRCLYIRYVYILYPDLRYFHYGLGIPTPPKSGIAGPVESGIALVMPPPILGMTDFITLLFTLSRVPGWVAHAVEEQRRQEAARHIDPNQHTYDGPVERRLPEKPI